MGWELCGMSPPLSPGAQLQDKSLISETPPARFPRAWWASDRLTPETLSVT